MEVAQKQLDEAEAATACAMREADEAREEAEAAALAADAARAANIKMMLRGRGLQANAGLSVTGPRC